MRALRHNLLYNYQWTGLQCEIRREPLSYRRILFVQINEITVHRRNVGNMPQAQKRSNGNRVRSDQFSAIVRDKETLKRFRYPQQTFG